MRIITQAKAAPTTSHFPQAKAHQPAKAVPKTTGLEAPAIGTEQAKGAYPGYDFGAISVFPFGTASQPQCVARKRKHRSAFNTPDQGKAQPMSKRSASSPLPPASAALQPMPYPFIQTKPGDKHDLSSPQLAGNRLLEKTFDNEASIGRFANAQGTHVRKLQEALLQLGFQLPASGADGKFGKETEDAVREFQQKASMSKTEIDGIVGRKTLGLLDRSLRNHEISTDTDKAADDLKLNNPQQQAEDEACKGKATDQACPVPNLAVEKGAEEAVKRIDKVLSEQLPPVKTAKADYLALFSQLFRNNDPRPLADTVNEVKTNFAQIKAFILNLKTDPSHVRCGTDCDGGCRSGSPAYHSAAEGKHIITFCPSATTHPERTSIMIHESHHAAIAGSKDIAYGHTRLIDKLDHQRALLNAASFHVYAALVEDPGSDFIGPKVKDKNTLSDPAQQKNVDQALAFIQQWFKLVTFDMSRVVQAMVEAQRTGAYPENSRTDLINDIYAKWFGVTPAPAKPREIDITKAKAIEERSSKMENAFDTPFTIAESINASEWERGPGPKIQLNQQLLQLDINHMVIALLQELVHATPEISAESEPLYVGAINDLRNTRKLAP